MQRGRFRAQRALARVPARVLVWEKPGWGCPGGYLVVGRRLALALYFRFAAARLAFRDLFGCWPPANKCLVGCLPTCLCFPSSPPRAMGGRRAGWPRPGFVPWDGRRP
eukprot:2946185-Alexandrium_andersonii.AAC.1